jgi:hypothetical protein
MLIGLCKALFLLVQLSASMSNYFRSEEDVDSGNISRKTKQIWNQNLNDV